jgi:hypothetical protein
MLYNKLKKGTIVFDKFFSVYGKIVDNKDIHNILVEYEDGGSGLYCLKKKCEDFDSDLIIMK